MMKCFYDGVIYFARALLKASHVQTRTIYIDKNENTFMYTADIKRDTQGPLYIW